MVRETKRDRVHLQGNRELIQRAFERVSPRTFAWRAHESRGGDIHGINRLLDPDRRTLVHQPGRTRATRFGKLADGRSQRFADVLHRLQFSITRRGKRQRLARRRAMAGADKHIPARDVQLYRNAGDFRAHGRKQDMHPQGAFAAERAANERTDDPHIFELEPETARDNILHALHKLGRIVQRQLLVAFPMRDGPRHLDRVMRFRRRDVGLLDLHQACILQRRSRVAFVDLHVLVVICFRLLGFFRGRFHSEQRLLGRVADFHQ